MQLLRMTMRLRGAYLILTAAAVLLSACSREKEPTSGKTDDAAESPVMAFRNLERATGFVGDDACFDCHETQYTGYQDHGMARSYYPLTAANRVEDTRSVLVVDTASSLRYTIVEELDGLYQEEFALDEAGDKIHSLMRRMDYVVGSGTAARTYVTELSGRLLELPLTWYTQEKRWDFSPGYEVANFRFGRTVPDRCMACHNSYPESVPYVEGKYVEVPHGIGCERCHGPGALHVEERLEVPEPAGDVDDSIVNPAHLPFDLRLDVCQQCHLHTTVSLLREGRGAFAYRPGQPLSEHIALFAEEDPSSVAGVDVISHADRMKQSKCFRATVGTENPLECTTCHDPHQGFRSLGQDYFNDTCLGCHGAESLEARLGSSAAAANHTPSSDCFDCHMPRVEVEDAPHSTFTDHLIRVVNEDTMPAPTPSHERVELRAYFERDQGTETGALYHAMAQVVYGNQMSRTQTIRDGVERLTELVSRDSSVTEAIFLMGLGYQMLGEHELSVRPLETAVRLHPSNPERLNALARAYELAGVKVPVAGRLYRRALSIQPAAARIRVNYGRFLESQGLLDQAAAEYSRAVEEDPWLDVGFFNLGTACVGKGELAQAEEAFRQAITLNPLYAEAMGNLASVYASQGREGEAGKLFERAVRAAPEDPTALGNLGAFRLNQGEEEEAVALLRRAVLADPSFTDAIANLSLAYFRIDDFESAREYARRALELQPGNELARQVLVATR